MQSVNSETVLRAKAESIIHIGQCADHLIATLSNNLNEEGPSWFEKLDIKDVLETRT